MFPEKATHLLNFLTGSGNILKNNDVGTGNYL